MIEQARFEEILEKFDGLGPIMVVGDVGVDKYTLGDVTRISPEAPVPVIEVKKEWMKLGLAGNVSDNLKSLGVVSTLVGVIGEDQHGNHFENLLEDSGLQTWGVIRDPNRKTTYKERVVTHSQQICRIDYESGHEITQGVYDKLESRFHEFKGDLKSVIIEDYGKGFVTEGMISFLVEQCKELGILLAIDPSRKSPAKWYKNVGLLKPNLEEAKILVKDLGFDSLHMEPVELARTLSTELNIQKVVITLGPKGMAFYEAESGKYQEIPTVANEVFDVSGAGDTAISALVSSLCANSSLEEACWIGNCSSAVVVGKKGTALVTVSELKDSFKVFQKNYASKKTS